MGFFTKILFCMCFCVLIAGCASNLRNHAIDFVGNYSEQVAKHVKSRKAQIEVLLGLLNIELLKNKYDIVKSEDINLKIDRLHDEQHFLYTLDMTQFFLEYEVIEEKQVSDDIREIIVKVHGKTIKLDKNNRSEIVEIPEEASLWLFRELTTNSQKQIIGPQPYKKKNPSE